MYTFDDIGVECTMYMIQNAVTYLGIKHNSLCKKYTCNWEEYKSYFSNHMVLNMNSISFLKNARFFIDFTIIYMHLKLRKGLFKIKLYFKSTSLEI